MEDLLPHDILYRKKMGFPTPIRQWLMDPKAEPLFDILRRKDGLIQSYLDAGAVETLLDRHQRGLEDAHGPHLALLEPADVGQDVS